MLEAIVDEAATRFGDTPAYVAADGWDVSYSDLAQLSHELAAALAHRGIGEGDVVALVMPSIPEYVIAYLAAARLGAITAGVNSRLTATERAGVLGIARPRLVIATTDLMPADATVPAADRLAIDRAPSRDDLFRGVREPGNWVDRLPDDPDRTVAIVFTSGTTGLPRGAVFANRQLDFITAVDTGRRWGGGAAQLAGTSFAHLGPTTKLAGSLHRGGTTYLMDRWHASDALRMITTHRMASVGGIPTQVALMLRDPHFDELDLDCVRAIVIGGGPATPALIREARARFDAKLAVRYSCTEAGIGVGTELDSPEEDAELTVGRAHGGVELTVRRAHATGIDAAGAGAPHEPTRQAATCDVGEVGEVCLRSPAVMSGYWHDPDATRTVFTADGAVRTGDLGMIDDQGRLRLVGRTKEMYVRGGYNVYPVEVEAALATHPAVAAIAIVPRPDDVMGEIGVAVVVPRAGFDLPSLDDLRMFAGNEIAAHKLPEAVVITDSLPLTAMDKVDRRSLAETVRADRPGPCDSGH